MMRRRDGISELKGSWRGKKGWRKGRGKRVVPCISMFRDGIVDSYVHQLTTKSTTSLESIRCHRHVHSITKC